jgi:hypothetical protein
MKRFFITILLTVFIIAAGSGAYGAAEQKAGMMNPVSGDTKTNSPDFSEGVNKAKDMILDYFSPLSGVVEDVKDRSIKIRLEGESSIKKGMRFSVFREGEAFYHPVTNEPIGRSETFVGRIEVNDDEASDGLYICTIVKGEIKSGDIARITSSKVKLAFFQDRKADWGLSEIFYGSLKDSGRFEILESYTPGYKPEDLSELARELDAEAVLMFSTGKRNDKKSVKIELFWAEDAKMFGKIKEMVSHDAVEMLASEEEFISTVFSDTEPWGSYDLSGGRLLAVGDVDGNGARELVVSDGNNLSIYSLTKDIREIWTVKGGSAYKHLSVDILDLNNNGRAEIFVTSIIDRSDETSDEGLKSLSDRSSVKSFVLEYDLSGGYRKIKDNLPYFMRVAGKTLLMQKFAFGNIFNGPVYEGKWQDESYQPESPVKLPDGANIYGFTFIDWQNRGQVHIMTFNDDGYLNLYNENGELIWRSSRKFGNFPLSFEKKTYSMAKTDDKWAVRGRLISIKTDRGQEIIVVNRVPVLSTVPGLGIKGAEVYSLWWNEGMMEEKLLMGEVSGNITDYWIEKGRLFLLARGDMLSFVKNAATGELSKGSTLYFYNIGEE